MDHLHLTQNKLEIDQITESVISEDCGAVSLFVGTTRNTFDCKKVLRLEYEAYEPMALKALKEISNDIRNKWSSVKNIAIYNRLGSVPIKEASVVIAISSPHRAESLAAVAYCIDRLKSSVPIWKKEIYEGSEEKGVWKENVECAWSKHCIKRVNGDHDEDRQYVQRSVETEQIDKNLIQINVSSEELEKRIQSFIERKREQVNVSNIQDFIPGGVTTAVDNNSLEETCARVRTLFTKRNDSKGHLKVRRVENEWGPQTLREPTTPKKQEFKGTPLNSIESISCGDFVKGSLPPGIEERVINVERYLSITPVEPDIYRRLKNMEDRIADLQSVSPEYARFWQKQIKEEKDCDYTEPSPTKLPCLFSADDIAKKIEEMEKQAAAF